MRERCWSYARWACLCFSLQWQQPFTQSLQSDGALDSVFTKMNYTIQDLLVGLYNLRVDAMTKPEGYSKKRSSDCGHLQCTGCGDKSRPWKWSTKYRLCNERELFRPEPFKWLVDHRRSVERAITTSPIKPSVEKCFRKIMGAVRQTSSLKRWLVLPWAYWIHRWQRLTRCWCRKLTQLPSLVSFLEQSGYTATAIHPYDTSMYKRKDVYGVMGFEQFIDQETMTYTDKIENNPYISDEAAYKEVLALLENDQQPQFVHLVTMQTHMPYAGKYDTLNYQASGPGIWLLWKTTCRISPTAVQHWKTL